MSTITIPKEYKTHEEFVGIPRQEYEAFLNWRKTIREFRPTAHDKRELRAARREYDHDETLTLHAFKQQLDA